VPAHQDIYNQISGNLRHHLLHDREQTLGEMASLRARTLDGVQKLRARQSDDLGESVRGRLFARSTKWRSSLDGRTNVHG